MLAMTTPTVQMTGSFDPRDSWTAGDSCTLAKSIELIATRSAFLVMREGFYGATRFEEFVRRTNLSEPAVAARLHDLVERGLLELEPYRELGQRTRQRYCLTDKGADLFPVIVSLMQWGNRWLSDSGGPAGLLHRDCGAVVSAELRCAEGHGVDLADLDLAPTA
jgi:DNA-binding HxlR family transcriptional regulator